MFAKINWGKDIVRTLKYNELKTEQGKAECLEAYNFIKDLDKLSYSDKLNRLKQRISLNEAVQKNSFHLSLNFAPSENFDKKKLLDISERFMEKIGLDKQPYLVYRHTDAGHPHLHIVSTQIQKNGQRIIYSPLGLHSCEKARIEVEMEFSLQPGETHYTPEMIARQQLPAKQIVYGKMESTRSISSVLTAVLHTYKYSSMEQLNAILRLYNVIADRGTETSFIYQHRGLLYQILDSEGKRVGVPIKASAIYFKPTLNFLEKKFQENEVMRYNHAQRIKTTIDFNLFFKSLSLNRLWQALENQAISVVPTRTKKGEIDQITFIDHQTKCIFHGSELGDQYSLVALEQRCRAEENNAQVPQHKPRHRQLMKQGE